MAVVKLSSSGRQLQVVLSEDLPAGSVLGASWDMVKDNISDSPFVLLSVMPFGVSSSRFPESFVFDDGSLESLRSWRERNVGKDSFSRDFKASRERRKGFGSKVVKLK